MSDSYRHTPVIGFCGSCSEKFYKALRNGRERVRVRGLMAVGEYDMLKFELVPWDEWQTMRDGKVWLGVDVWSESPMLMRK